MAMIDNYVLDLRRRGLAEGTIYKRRRCIEMLAAKHELGSMRRWLMVAVLLAGCGTGTPIGLAATTTTVPDAAVVSVAAKVAPTTVPPTTEGPREVLKTVGRTATDTDLFTVAGVWQIACKVTGGSTGMSVTIRKADGSSSDYISFPVGDNTSSKRQGGTFYLEVTPFGSASWDCTVTDMPG